MPGVATEPQTNSGAAVLKAGTNNAALKYLSGVKPKLLIDGQWVDSKSGKTFDVINPTNEEVIFQVADGQPEDIDAAVQAARRAFDEGPWSRTMTGAQRGRVLFKLADLIEQNADELAALESLDNGKPYAVARAADVMLSANHIRYFAGWADKIHGKTLPVEDWFGTKVASVVLREPIGVIGQVIPWNFPLLMAAWKIGPALACGNTIVLKPAEQTPLTALRLGELALEAGLPAGVLNVVTGFGLTAGAPLVAHPQVDKIAFTGSTEVGKIIMKEAADAVKPVSLELGGKSPLIVWKDVDIDSAVATALMATQFNMGQCCAAGTRLMVHADIYDEFVTKLGEAARNVKVGDPFNSETQNGPQVDLDQFNKILGYIDIGQREGARLVCGGRRVGERGYFIEPTIFADVEDNMRIACEEIFGPVQCVMKYNTMEEAIRRANGSEYGLAAGILSNDVHVLNKMARSLKAGTVWQNTWNVFGDSHPFGGYKQSGIGRDKGENALEHYTATKCVIQKLEGEQAWL